MSLLATDLDHAYRRGTPVLAGVSLRIDPGELVAIVGPNGAGKTTLLRCLAGLLEPSRGRVTLDQRPVRPMPPGQRARRLAYLPQRPDVAMPLTVRQVVALGALATGAERDRLERADAALERVGLLARAGEAFTVLSAGQQQRAALARVLAQLTPVDPAGRGERAEPTPAQILLADEPVSAMDPRHAMQTLDLLRSLTRALPPLGVGIVLHDLTLAARFADRVLVLDAQGRVAADAPPSDALAPGLLEPVFGVAFDAIETSQGTVPLPRPHPAHPADPGDLALEPPSDA